MIIQAKVKTNQPEFLITLKSEKEWAISVKSTPEQNKANMEIIKNLQKTYNTVKILKGLKSKNKQILIV